MNHIVVKKLLMTYKDPDRQRFIQGLMKKLNTKTKIEMMTIFKNFKIKNYQDNCFSDNLKEFYVL